jgi:hypothetical protein
MLRIVGVLVIALCTLATSAFAQGLTPAVWKNQRGSILKVLAVDPSGAFKGVYVNNAVGFHCQGTPYDVNGRVRGTRIAFRVVWKNIVEDCHSSTVWHGRLHDQMVFTRWTLRQDGGGVLRGADTFQRQ